MPTFSKAQAIKRFSDKPVLLDPTALSVIEALSAAEEATNEFCYVTSQSDVGGGRPYRVQQGVAFVPVSGMLLHKLDLHIDGWLTGYAYIENSVRKAMEDSEVKAVALEVSSHGGEVHGAFETTDAIFEMRGTKPIYAIIDGYAHSGGYTLASAADKIFLSKTGSAGSIGVVTMHVSYSEYLKRDGIEVTYIYAGEHKVDGNPYQPLGKDARNRIQARIEKSYDVFVNSVARNRDMSPDAVRATKAGIFSGSEAVELGLADAVLSPREAVQAILSELSGSRPLKTTGGKVMAGNQTTAPEAAAPVATQEATQAQAAQEAAQTAQETTQKADNVQTERQRISAILTSEEAKGREALANYFALETDMSSEAAIIALSKAAKENVSSANTDVSAAFDKLMTSSGNPEVGGGTVSSQQCEDDDAAKTQRILKTYSMVTGVKH